MYSRRDYGQGGRMPGSTMGETTRESLASVIRGANAYGGGFDAGQPMTRPPSGGGGLGGSFGKAPTGRGLFNPAPPAAAAPPPSDYVSTGRRARVAPASLGARNLWDAGTVNDPPVYSPAKDPSPRPVPAARVVSRKKADSTSGAAAAAPAAGPPSLARRTLSARSGNASAGAQASLLRSQAAQAKKQVSNLSAVKEEASPVKAAPPSKVARKPSLGRQASQPSTAAKPAASAAAKPAASGTSSKVEAPAPAGKPKLRWSVESDPKLITAVHLQHLEEEIREALKDKSTVYEDEKALLTSLFERTDDGGEGHMSQADLAHVCEALSVTVTDAECAALFRKHGFEDREMPFAYFRQLMLSNPLRTLADSAPVQEGAFPPDRVADFRGKIIYHPCRTGVFTPSDFAPEAAARSATLPNVRLFLEFVYGYDGVTATSKNLFYTGSGEVAYFTAGVGVVLSRGERGRPATQSQRFFLGHNDDISSMAVLEAPVTARGVAYPARTLAPTGQVTNVQNGPTVFVWDTRTGSQEGDNVVARMDFAKDARGIQALAFSEDGKYLVCVATDNRHTVYVYDWAHERLVCEGPGYNGEPPQVTGAVWDAYGSKQFVTYGRRHAKVWTPSADMERWESRSLSFGKAAMENITSAVFLPRADPQAPAVLVCGTAAGLLYVFKDGKCVREVKAHAKGPRLTMRDGSLAYMGVRALALAEMEVNGARKLVLVSGGADGVLQRWDCSASGPKEGVLASPAIKLVSPGTGTVAPCIRAVDVSPDGKAILVGTSACNMYEVSADAAGATQEVIMDGHEGDVWGLCAHPTVPELFATACDDTSAHVWNRAEKRIVLSCTMGFKGRCCAFSPAPCADDPHAVHLAIGGSQGELLVVRVTATGPQPGLRAVFQATDASRSITCLRFSPDGSCLAVGNAERVVDIYSTSGETFRRTAKCVGHSGTITSMDWSADGGVLQTTSAAYEIIYFDPQTGRLVPYPQIDTVWHTWTALLGFPVMGIWPPDSDGTDINALHRSHSGQLLVTAGDDGFVSLFNSPCVVHEAACRSYRGQSSHVMGVSFNCDDSYVFSAGGKDRSIFQFRVETVPQEPVSEAQKQVWASIDGTGKNFGWVKQPADTPTPALDLAVVVPVPGPVAAMVVPDSRGPSNHARSAVASVPSASEGAPARASAVSSLHSVQEDAHVAPVPLASSAVASTVPSAQEELPPQDQHHESAEEVPDDHGAGEEDEVVEETEGAEVQGESSFAADVSRVEGAHGTHGGEHGGDVDETDGGWG